METKSNIFDWQQHWLFSADSPKRPPIKCRVSLFQTRHGAWRLPVMTPETLQQTTWLAAETDASTSQRRCLAANPSFPRACNFLKLHLWGATWKINRTAPWKLLVTSNRPTWQDYDHLSSPSLMIQAATWRVSRKAHSVSFYQPICNQQSSMFIMFYPDSWSLFQCFLVKSSSFYWGKLQSNKILTGGAYMQWTTSFHVSSGMSLLVISPLLPWHDSLHLSYLWPRVVCRVWT